MTWTARAWTESRLEKTWMLLQQGLKMAWTDLQENLKKVDFWLVWKWLTSEATPSATQFFKRSYKISHNPGL